MKHFALKFIDIMIGVIFGLGFQWWPNLHEPWQYIAFIFAYLNVIDYWIDYSPALKKFPPKTEIDLLLDIGILFTLFLFIYSTQMSIVYFLTVFVIFRIVDLFWLLRARYQYALADKDKTFVNTWLKFDVTEIIAALVLSVVAKFSPQFAFIAFLAFVGFRVLSRILASVIYKSVHFA